MAIWDDQDATRLKDRIFEWFNLEARVVDLMLILMIVELIVIFFWGTHYLDYGFDRYCKNPESDQQQRSLKNMMKRKADNKEASDGLMGFYIMKYLVGDAASSMSKESDEVILTKSRGGIFRAWGQGDGVGHGGFLDDDPDPVLQIPQVKWEVYSDQISACRVLYILSVMFGLGSIMIKGLLMASSYLVIKISVTVWVIAVFDWNHETIDLALLILCAIETICVALWFACVLIRHDYMKELRRIRLGYSLPPRSNSNEKKSKEKRYTRESL